MFGNTQYHGIIRRYIIAFGRMFSNVQITSFDKYTENPDDPDIIRVPIIYARKNKFRERIKRDPDLGKPRPSITLPIMSFEDTSYTYNSERKANSRHAIRDVREGTSVYTSVPYDIGFSLSIYTKYLSDAHQIVEKILPYFKPSRVFRMKHIDSPEVWHKIPVTLTSISPEIEYDGDFETKGNNIFTLEFELQGDLYGPVDDISDNIIEKTRVSVAAHERSPTAAADELPSSGIVALTRGDKATGNILKKGSTDIERHPIINSDPDNAPDYNKWIEIDQLFDILPDHQPNETVGPADEDDAIGRAIYGSD